MSQLITDSKSLTVRWKQARTKRNGTRAHAIEMGLTQLIASNCNHKESRNVGRGTVRELFLPFLIRTRSRIEPTDSLQAGYKGIIIFLIAHRPLD